MRYPDWERRLEAYFVECRSKTFEIGVFDCSTFALGALQRIAGTDLMSKYGGYSSFLGGYRKMSKLTGKRTFEDFADFAFADLLPVKIGYSQRGDIVLLYRGDEAKPNDRYALGVVGLDGDPLGVADIGLQKVAHDRVRKGWH
jgi:hypothetical protein